MRAFKRKWGLGHARMRPPDEGWGSHPYFSAASGPLEEKPPPPRSPSLLEPVLELRKLLRHIVETVAAGREVSGHDIRRLNGFLEGADVRHRMRKTSGGVRLDVVPLEEEAWVVGAIALSAAEFLASGDRGRLKVCDNHGCRWVFYDGFKNRSRRWCNSNLCGNLFKVRRYRSRHGRRPAR